MYIGIPLLAVVIVTIIIYLLIKSFGIHIKFALVAFCGFIGLFLGLILPKILLPQMSLLGTLISVLLFMFFLSVLLAWFFGLEEEASGEIENIYDINLHTEVLSLPSGLIISSEEKFFPQGQESNFSPTLYVAEQNDLEDTMLPEDEMLHGHFPDNAVYEPNNLLDNVALKDYSDAFTAEEKQDFMFSENNLKQENISDIFIVEEEKDSTQNEQLIEQVSDCYGKFEMPDEALPNIDAVSSETEKNIIDSTDTSSAPDEDCEEDNLSSDTQEEVKENEVVKIPMVSELRAYQTENIALESNLLDEQDSFSEFTLCQETEYQPVQCNKDTIDETSEGFLEKQEFAYGYNLLEEAIVESPLASTIENDVQADFHADEPFADHSIDCFDSHELYEVVEEEALLEEQALPEVEEAQDMQQAPSIRQVPKSDSFDDLLDFAFGQKEKHNYEDALLGFTMAYDLYPKSELACMLAIEIANIYKQKGKYDLAISSLQKGLDNSKDESIRQEFVSNIAYIRIIRNMLITNQLDLLPYDEIPAKVKEDIESEFVEWKQLT